jgi:hypothetical protein
LELLALMTMLPVEGIVGDLLETFGPVVAAAGKNPRGFIGELQLHPVAVELDLMDPALARWHPLD